MVTEVGNRLNLTSQDSKVRIGQRINDRYRRVTSSIGLITSRRIMVDLELNSTTNTELPEITIENLEKVLRVTTTGDGQTIRVLREAFYDDLTRIPTANGKPKAYAIKRMGARQVIIVVDSFTPEEDFTLHVEGYDVTDVLADDAEPYIPSDFHDILVEGAMSDEYKKLEKTDLSRDSELRYTQRLSDLRMFIAKSAYLDIVQGKNKPSRLWLGPWFSRITLWE